MKHNQNDDASNQKGASHKSNAPKNQDSSNNGRTAQHGPSNRDQSGQSGQDDQQTGKQGSKKHADASKSK
jgi:hypothetical protein